MDACGTKICVSSENYASEMRGMQVDVSLVPRFDFRHFTRSPFLVG